MKNMDISVLMSVYRSEKPAYLDRSLQSIWDDQTLKPEEIVLVQDGPVGADLAAVIDRWRDRLEERMKLIVNEVNLGLTKSLNRGLEIAGGKYLARMDSDDISAPTRFERQKEYLDNHPDVAVVGGFLQEFDATHDNLGVREYPVDNEHVMHYIYKASPLAHPTVMMRREIFDRGIRYDERYRTSQDIALWYDVLEAGYKIGNLDEVTIFFRRDGDVFKRRSREKAANEFKIYLNGIHRLYGLLTWKYAYPVARYMFRMIPTPLVARIYDSSIRTRFLQ